MLDWQPSFQILSMDFDIIKSVLLMALTIQHSRQVSIKIRLVMVVFFTCYSSSHCSLL